ncbi:hypothetical protein D0Z03_002719 [Geotrichum reessii]|nr:hypothetical protein D0Z03_002719 [Galactomyces reessii]
MIRFGSTAASRSLRTQSAANLLVRPHHQFNNNSNNPTAAANNYHTVIDPTPAAATYDWTVNSSDFKFNQDQSEKEFQEILGEIAQRFRRPFAFTLPTILDPNSAVAAIIGNNNSGGALNTPNHNWKKGPPPTRKQLMKLIRRVTTPETAGITLDIINTYVEHYPREVQSTHIGTFLRTAARTGYFYKVLDLIQNSPAFAELINDDVAKEAIRLYSIRIVAAFATQSASNNNNTMTTGGEPAYRSLARLYQKMSVFTNAEIEEQLDTHLVMLYGLAPFYKAHAHRKDYRALVQMHLAVVREKLAQTTPIAEDSKVSAHYGLNYYYMNLVLGRLGLRLLPEEELAALPAHNAGRTLDLTKLDELIARIEVVFRRNKVSSPLERYVKQAAQGLLAEQEISLEKMRKEATRETAIGNF